jgi:HK97 family phage major capsid protein
MEKTTIYNKAFWNVMRGKQADYEVMNAGKDITGSYTVPNEFNDKYMKALEKENVFRRLSTVVNTTSVEGTIHAITSNGTAEWVK